MSNSSVRTLLDGNKNWNNRVNAGSKDSELCCRNISYLNMVLMKVQEWRALIISGELRQDGLSALLRYSGLLHATAGLDTRGPSALYCRSREAAQLKLEVALWHNNAKSRAWCLGGRPAPPVWDVNIAEMGLKVWLPYEFKSDSQ